MPDERAHRRRELRALTSLFLRLGATAFGGPAAHIALMEREVVVRRRWLTHDEFLDLLGATNLIPGPNSTEMAIHIGHRRAGWPGLLVAGACFIAPAVAMVIALAWIYLRFGRMPAVAGVLYGLEPVVLAVIVQAIARLGRVATRDRASIAVAAGALVAYLLHAHELALIAAGGACIALARRVGTDRSRPAFVPSAIAPLAIAGAGVASLASWPRVFVLFLKIGATLYGSGYVLVAYVRRDFVERTHWLTNAQLLDAISIGQFTPGPVFTTATFVGYLVDGPWGAAAATVGIFLPAFAFVAISIPLLASARNNPSLRAVLDGVNAASLGVMAAVTIELARATIVPHGAFDIVAAALAVVAAAVLLATKVNATWVMLGGAVVGLAARAVWGRG